MRIAPPAGGEATTLIVTGVPWRTAWRYAERGFRHLYWDAGTMLAQTLALAPEGRLITRFPDARVSELVGADGTHEFPLALVALGDGAPRIEPAAPAAGGAVDHAPRELPLITAAQRAGDGDQLGEPWPLQHAPVDDAVILRRGSTRRMDPERTIPRAAFERIFTSALRDARHPHYVAIHGVDDVEPGIYRWPERCGPATCARSCSSCAGTSRWGGPRRSWSWARWTSKPSTIASTARRYSRRGSWRAVCTWRRTRTGSGRAA